MKVSKDERMKWVKTQVQIWTAKKQYHNISRRSGNGRGCRMLKKGAESKTIKKILQCFYNCTSITLNIKISFIFSILSLFCTSLEPTPSQASLHLKAESHLGLSILKSNLFLIKKKTKQKQKTSPFFSSSSLPQNKTVIVSCGGFY